MGKEPANNVEQDRVAFWRHFAEKASEKVMDTANLAFGALVVGQWLSGQTFRWTVAVIGVATWLLFFALAAALVYWQRGRT